MLIKQSIYQNSNKEKISARNATNYIKNKEEIDLRNKKYRDSHPDQNKLYRDTHREEISIQRAAYRTSLSKETKIRMAEYQRFYRECKREEISAQRSEYRASFTPEEKEELSLLNKIYQLKNKDKIAIQRSKWAKENMDKILASCAKRRAQKHNATPKWLTPKNLEDIKTFYSIALDLRWLSEEILEVDHIIPLLGKNVCGLHVAANLQIIPHSLNAKKKNKFDFQEYNKIYLPILMRSVNG